MGSQPAPVDLTKGDDIYDSGYSGKKMLTVNGEAGNDQMHLSGTGAAALNGGAGDDILGDAGGTTRQVVLNGGSGDDLMTFGGDNPVFAIGGTGNDTFENFGPGEVAARGGKGADMFAFVGGAVSHSESIVDFRVSQGDRVNLADLATINPVERTDLSIGHQADGTAYLDVSTANGHETHIFGLGLHREAQIDAAISAGWLLIRAYPLPLARVARR